MAQAEFSTDILEWAHRHIFLRNLPFSLSRYPFLRQIYADFARHQVFRKSAQVGASTYHIIKSLWLASTQPVKIIYFFPTDTDVQDFSQDRVMPIIGASSLLSEQVKDVNKVGLKQLGGSSLYFRGLLGKVRVRSVDADYIILDELDMADSAQKEYARDRIIHSPLGWQSELSTPSLPGVGIDQSFQGSDQHFWLMRCPACSFEEPLEENFPECLLEKDGTISVACPRCHHPLDIASGRWVARRPGNSDIRGYQLSQLIASIISPESLLKEFRSAKTETGKRRFYNSMLGLPYAGQMVPLDAASLRACLGDEPMRMEQGPAYMGVDVGDTLHIAIGKITSSGSLQVFWLEATESWQRLDALLGSGKILCTVIDAMPYKHSAKQLALKYPGRIYIAYYQGEHLSKGVEGKGGKAVPKVLIDRTESLDELVAKLFSRQIILPASGAQVEETLLHLGRLRKERRESPDGKYSLQYARGLEDHFAMALNYLLVATMIAPVQVQDGVIEVGSVRTFT